MPGSSPFCCYTASNDSAMRPLEGLTILDLTRHLPGPYATMLLGDLGADIWKLERPDGGDIARRYPPFVDGQGAFFATLNRNKKSVTLDLKSDEASEIIGALLEKADVMVESFRPGVLERLGLPVDELRADHPGLVTCSLSGFGRTGPEAGRAGHDLTYAARAGLLDRCRKVRGDASEGSPPVIPGAQFADLGGALFAAIRVLAALLGRERHGERGEHLDISLTESALSLVAPHVTAESADGGAGESDILSGERPAYTLYETAGGEYLAVGALEPKFWQAFLNETDLAGLETEGLATGEAGRKARSQVADVIAREPMERWLERFEGVDACVEPVQSLLEAVQDELFRGRGAIADVAGVTHVRTPATPEDLDLGSAPELGGQTDAILAEAGYSSAEVESFRADGVC
jgi:crotonobetainyl-CoA:carnitine CoA-transferase CaiB-like acyl-CoA transferase